MKLLLRGTDLVGLPVVTLAGDDIAEVRDVLFDADAGRVVGFTLNKRGRFAGRMREVLTREQIHTVGPAAVMVPADITLSPPTASDLADRGAGGDVIADRVMTDSGVQVGAIIPMSSSTRPPGRWLVTKCYLLTNPSNAMAAVPTCPYRRRERSLEKR